jgi:two-component system, chemotaxis family, protein-glutamate methylesterase/glutaminase
MTRGAYQAVVMGASAGALDALSSVLAKLPHGFPLPLLIVTHLPSDKDSLLSSLLAAKCQIAVREAEDKEPIVPGVAFIAPPDYHLLVEKDERLSLSSEEPVQFSRPSIDVLFESAADAYGATLIGIILTGANEDGARGLRAVADAGGLVLVQRADLAYASTMPRAALAACPMAREMTLEEIATYLCETTTMP